VVLRLLPHDGNEDALGEQPLVDEGDDAHVASLAPRRSSEAPTTIRIFWSGADAGPPAPNRAVFRRPLPPRRLLPPSRRSSVQGARTSVDLSQSSPAHRSLNGRPVSWPEDENDDSDIPSKRFLTRRPMCEPKEWVRCPWRCWQRRSAVGVRPRSEMHSASIG
jgi:hypothetical protein